MFILHRLSTWIFKSTESHHPTFQDAPEAKRLKPMKSSDKNDSLRAEAGTDSGNSSKAADKNATPPEPPKQDYIHVRARRGQATDSHSLAERVSSYTIFFSLIFGFHFNYTSYNILSQDYNRVTTNSSQKM